MFQYHCHILCEVAHLNVSLKEVTRTQCEPGAMTIEDRLRTTMREVVVSIKGCAKVCDSYQKRHITGMSHIDMTVPDFLTRLV